VAGTDAQMDGLMLVKAQAPLAELMSYQNRLNALTSGQGRYTLSLSHYEAVPPTVQQQLTSQHKVAASDE
jgi:elongation factor G